MRIDNKRVTFAESRGAPSPTATEHLDDSSQESLVMEITRSYSEESKDKRGKLEVLLIHEVVVAMAASFSHRHRGALM